MNGPLIDKHFDRCIAALVACRFRASAAGWEAERTARLAAESRLVEVEKELAEARRQIEAGGRVYGMVQQASAEVVAINDRLRSALCRVYFWINDYPEIGTHGAVAEMVNIRDVLGYLPSRAALSKEKAT